MLGLIKKDMLMIKGNLKYFVILVIIYSLFALQGEMNLTTLLPFVSVILMLSTFSYDAFNKWDVYVSTIPDGRKKSVRAKYATTVILIILTAIITLILTASISYIRTEKVELNYLLSMSGGTLFSTVLLLAFMYPAIYKFGIEKARIGIFVGVFGVAFILGIVSRFIDFDLLFSGVISVLENYWVIILPLILVISLFVSIKISESINAKKEY